MATCAAADVTAAAPAVLPAVKAAAKAVFWPGDGSAERGMGLLRRGVRQHQRGCGRPARNGCCMGVCCGTTRDS